MNNPKNNISDNNKINIIRNLRDKLAFLKMKMEQSFYNENEKKFIIL